MPNLEAEIIQYAFDLGKDFTKTLFQNDGNHIFGLVITDDFPLFGEAFLIGCYKNHKKDDHGLVPEYDKNKRLSLFFDLINNHRSASLSISYRGVGNNQNISSNECAVDSNENRIRVYDNSKHANKFRRWQNNGYPSGGQPGAAFYIINSDNVLDYYLTQDAIRNLNDQNFNSLSLVDQKRTKIYDYLGLPQPGTNGAVDQTIFVKGIKGDTLTLWDKYGCWDDPISSNVCLGKVDGRGDSISLSNLFDCDKNHPSDDPVKSSFGQIVFSRNIQNDIPNKKNIILNGMRAFEKIDYVTNNSSLGVVLICSIKDIFKYGLEQFREKLRGYIQDYERLRSSSRKFGGSLFCSKCLYWTKTPLVLDSTDESEQDNSNLRVHLFAPNDQSSTQIIALKGLIKKLLPVNQNDGIIPKKFIWDIYNRFFRGGSYDIGNLKCYKEFIDELNGLQEEWRKIWEQKGPHPYNGIIRNLPDCADGESYGMLVNYHGSPVKIFDEISGKVFSEFKEQKLVLIEDEIMLQAHKGKILLFGKASPGFLEKILKSGFKGDIIQIALKSDCNLKIQANSIKNLGILDNYNDDPLWSLPINIQLSENEERGICNESPVSISGECQVSVNVPDPGLADGDFGENNEEIDIDDYFDREIPDDMIQNDGPGGSVTSAANIVYDVSSLRMTYFSENQNAQFRLKFGTPKVGDMVILPVDEKKLRACVMDLDHQFNHEFWPDNDLWKRALRNWINQSTMEGVLDHIGDRFSANDINRYRNRDRVEPGAPDNKDDFECLVNNIRAYGMHGFGGIERMNSLDVDSHWVKITQKRNVHRCIGRDFHEIIHNELRAQIKVRPDVTTRLTVNLFNRINGDFSVFKISNLTFNQDQE